MESRASQSCFAPPSQPSLRASPTSPSHNSLTPPLHTNQISLRSFSDGGRATQWARKQLRNLRDNQATAHRLKLESMFSFLPKKLIEVVDSELTDDKGVAKNQILPSPSKTDFYGVLVMADLVKSTVLSEEMEDKAFAENCGGGLDSIEEDDMARSHRKGSIYEGEGSKSSHNRAAMAKNAIKKQAHKLRDAQNDASKLGAERLRTVLTKYFRLLVGVTMNHGGDVVRIAGDAIISIFEDNSKSIKRSLAKAQSACLDILNSYNNYVIDGNTLQVRMQHRRAALAGTNASTENIRLTLT